MTNAHAHCTPNSWTKLEFLVEHKITCCTRVWLAGILEVLDMQTFASTSPTNQKLDNWNLYTFLVSVHILHCTRVRKETNVKELLTLFKLSQAWKRKWKWQLQRRRIFDKLGKSYSLLLHQNCENSKLTMQLWDADCYNAWFLRVTS